MGEAVKQAQAEPVCVLGHHELDYPRNIATQQALRDAGYAVHLCHSQAPFPFRHLVLAWALLRAPRAAKVVFVTEGAHRLVPFVRLVARLSGRRVLFDPFLSRYNTRVEDRKLHQPGSYEARVAHFQDWSSTHAADHLVFDTHEHRDYFFERYRLRKPSTIVPVGVSETLFQPRDEGAAAAEDGSVRVLFYGTYIPLQGIETIVDAAARLTDPAIRIMLVGDGQTRAEMEAHARALGRLPLTFAAPLPFDELPSALSACHIALGIFGVTDKAARVVPNKVVQAAAMGCAIISADTPAIRRYFTHGESIYLVPAGDPDALAEAISVLAAAPALRARLGGGARRVFEEHFSARALSAAVASAVRQTREG